ncbi:MAG: hypothetical protein A2X49_09895 [Lentisphaerae bacterium GWF2_52_8]|nr:MAG: hypothetical protein A2X49_09895 [Lentisphaerae bacterium GWF2_52_8]
MKRILLLLLFTIALVSVQLCSRAEEALSPEVPSAKKLEADSPEAFLELVRHPPGRECWAMMSGKIFHRRSGQDTVEAPLYVGIRFTPERSFAQVLINKDEGYYVGQSYQASADSTTVIPAIKPGLGKKLLAEFGVRAEDLTMSFLFWKFREEQPREDAKGGACRVFLLDSPDGKEFVRVFINIEYHFPVKVEWFKQENSKAPERSLEIGSFRKENDFWVVKSLNLSGEGWRSKMEFDETRAGYSQDMVPKDLFKSIPGVSSPIAPK